MPLIEVGNISKKLYISDFDGTIIKENLEKSFLLYMIKKDFITTIKLIFRYLQNFFMKIIIKSEYKKMKIKQLYKNVDVISLKSDFLDFLSTFKFSINDSLFDLLKKGDTLIVLTRCPRFFCETFLSEKVHFSSSIRVFGTILDRDASVFTGKTKIKFTPTLKKKLVSEIKDKKEYYLVGFGDSKEDFPFLEIMDEAYLVNHMLSLGTQFKYFQPSWKKNVS